MADFKNDRGFGQKLPPLHIYLKQVLDKYPEGGQILKELVQNADDAGATNVIFLLDQTDYPDQSLWSDSLRKVQGAALYAYNDATFTEKDWTSIQHPSQSGKIDDLAKVGRFGLGFISVYHLTDLPSILSGDTIGFLDPLEQYFSYDPHTRTNHEGKKGQDWKISSELLKKFPDQFTPYLQDIFRCDEANFENGCFNGTIFRFPLRREKSKLSESLFDDKERVDELFRSFETDAEISLLFLKYVKSISVYEKGKGNETARLVFKIEVPEEDRPAMHSNIEAFLSKIPEKKDFQTLSYFRVHKEIVPDGVETVSRYITLNALRTEDISSDLRELINDGELKLLPWMGISFRSISSVENSSPDGRTFCFLPLPESEQTGLPVNVHGYFGLGDNRRGIKWPDKESLHDKKAQWNMLLVAEVFPKVYAELILAVIAKSNDTTYPMTPEDVYKAWPTPSSIKEEWVNSIKISLQRLGGEEVFYSDHEGGRWMKSREVYIDTEDDLLFAKVLKHKHYPVAKLPNHVTDSLRWANVGFRKIKPQVLRDCIRGDPLDFLTSKEKLQLLEYVTRDTVSDLSDLHLLPLQDGTFTPFCSSASTVYIASSENPSVLLPNLGTRLASNDMPKILETTEVLTNSQLKLLQADDVAPLLREMLPSHWLEEGKDAVKLQWTPGCNQHPPASWLQEMWKWLTQNLTAIPLVDFEGIPLVPMEHNKHITKLLKNTMIFHKETGTSGCSNQCLSDSGCSFLETFGVVVLRHELPSYILSHPHLGSFIKSPNPEGVMAVLEDFAVKVNLKELVEEANTNIKDELQRVLSQLRQITSEQKIILRELPIFKGSDGVYASAKSCGRAVPSSFQEIPVKTLRKTRLILTNSLDNFATKLDIHKESVHELLEENVLPAVSDRFYTNIDSVKIMTWVLERPEYHSLVKKLRFLPTSRDLELSSPVELYEPTQCLRVLFRDRPVFPTDVYSQDRLVGFLKQIGLREDSQVTAKEVMEVAEAMSEDKTAVDTERAEVLMQHINRFPHLLSERVTSDGINEPLFKFMEELAWVPCESSPPADYPGSAGWFGNSNTLYLPRQIGLIETAMLQGSVVALISMQGMKQELLELFGWSREMNPNEDTHVEAAVRQLRNVTDNFGSTEETNTVSKTTSVIYEFLGKASAPTLELPFGKYVSDSQPWVWHGSGFTTPDKVALSIGTLGVNLAPYLHIIPHDMLKHRAFLETMGVQQTFQESALCTVLISVKQKHEGQVNMDRTELEADLNLVCNILRYIATLERFNSENSTILVPCRTQKKSKNILLMVPASECLYVDEERLAKQLYEEGFQDDFDKQVIHEQVSNDLAKRLGLDPLSHFIAPAEALEYDMAGPHETTVNAIKRNLDMYKEGVGIFKELIQNADDAGATEVKFLIDWRRNEETAHNLLSDGMIACHGPSIWAYNNARFSKEDIKNICSIAAQSKKHQLDKVGRFGLGFTSVYHLTDVPSVVSGPYVLICDPRTTHLGSRVQPGQPGIKLDLSNPLHRRTLKSYPNQFQPYNGIFGCDMHESTEGFADTLIRLPLRTVSAARQEHNQLSHHFYDTKEQIEPLLESLKQSSNSLLLFTQNVVHVSVGELQSNDVKDIKNIISVKIERILQMPRSIGGQDGDMRTERRLLKATALAMKNYTTTVPETTMVVKVSREASEDHKTVKPQKEVWNFIISSSMDDGEILTMARSDDGIRSGVLPCGGVAAELVSDNEVFVPKLVEGKAFSYLPLDVSTGLPFHVNGNFMLQPNRRQLWSKPSSSTGEFESMWNECFIKSVLCRSFLNLLEALRELQGQNEIDARAFQRLWPTTSRSETDFQTFVGAYYSAIVCSRDPPTVVYTNNQWVSMHDCFFTDWKHNDPKDLRSSVKSVLSNKMYPKTWVELDSDVVYNITNIPENRYFDNTYHVHRFLQEIFFPLLSSGDQIEPSDRDEIILHILDIRLGEEKGKLYDAFLTETRSIPVSPRGEALVMPNKLVNPSTSIGSLFNEADSRFPCGGEYRNDNRLLSLEQLGMASHDLCWDDICERAESMLMGERRSDILLKLIDKKLRQGVYPTLDQKRRIREAAFLPVLQKPESYPLEWCEFSTEFMSAVSMYEFKHIDLIGSIHPLLDEARLGPEAMNEMVKTFIGFNEKEVEVSDVIKQLEKLIKSKVTNESSPIANRMYTFLQNRICVCRDGQIYIAGKYMTDFYHLRTLEFVLCEGQFRKCRQIAFNYKGRSGPYLYSKPPMLSQFSNLLKVCGVKDNFDLEDYIETLQYLKTEYEDVCLPEEAFRAAKDMVSEIVSRLVTLHGDDETDQIHECLQNGKVFVPDYAGVLRKPSELTFNDMHWEENNPEEVYTHPDITYKDAKALGITTAREKELEKYSSGFESDFGQVEELTDRLRNILRDYPNVSDVLKELLQNADDAGATEIHFVYDPRRHSSRKIISMSWAEVQQLPALCVYNNRPFSEADIKGIQKVGIGGKRNDIATTGRFGIGFNAVYHLTDCPSFLSSRDTLCVFDPLLKYVPRARKDSPGQQWQTREEFRQKFPDMMSGFLEDFDEFNGSEGTMFRLPLRSTESVISGKVLLGQDVEKLLKDFEKVSTEALLFLNNIKKISISCITEQPQTLDTKYVISSELTDQDQKYREDIVQHLNNFKNTPCQDVQSMCRVYRLLIHDSRESKQTWLVSQMLGFNGLPPSDELQLSTATSLKKALPRGGVAALISEDATQPNQQYKAYCFLPLPILTKLPVHVNGMFELDSSRKNLLKGNLNAKDGSPILKWNRQLIMYVIAPAYAELLLQAGRKILNEAEDRGQYKDSFAFYDELFPKKLPVLRNEWLLLAKETLSLIGRENLKVLPVARPKEHGLDVTWYHPNSNSNAAFFDDLDRNKAKDALRSFLLRVGFNLLKSSSELCNAFNVCDVKAELVSPQVVVKYMSTESIISPWLPATLKDTAFEGLSTFKEVFKYCLDGITQPTQLNGLPFRLANDCSLDVLRKQNGLYVSSHWRVLPRLQNLFVHYQLVKLCTDWFQKNATSIAASGVFKKFTISELSKHLGRHLPEEWHGCDHHVDWTPSTNGHPTEAWLKNLWIFLCSNETSDTCLKPIEGWPVFPTTSRKLVPPRLSKRSLLLVQELPASYGFSLQNNRKIVIDILRKLSLPEVDVKGMTDLEPSVTVLLNNHLALLERQGDVLNVIQSTRDKSGLVCAITHTDCTHLLQYFQEACQTSLSEENFRTIKSLPIFILLGGAGTTDLQRSKNYCRTDGYSLLTVEAKIWMNRTNCVFIQSNRDLNLIYDKLGITPITHADVYLNYILPSFPLLSPEAQIDYMSNIRDKVKFSLIDDEYQAILNRLSRLEFIKDVEQNLRTADYFYDPANPVFEAMVDHNSLLPKQMAHIKDIFTQIGLHVDVTKALFIEFARKVEHRARNMTDSQTKILFNDSKLLTEELKHNEDLQDDQKFLTVVAQIKFIPPVPVKRELTEIHPAFSESDDNPNKLNFIAYKGSVPDRHMELVWSVAKLLPKHTIPTSRELKGRHPINLHGCLGIKESLEPQKVVTHIQNVCLRMEKKNVTHKEDKLASEVRKTLKVVTNKMLLYLKANLSKHADYFKRHLQQTPICLVANGTILVRANQLVFELKETQKNVLSPYLFKVPMEELSEFYSVLKLLGAQDLCSFDQLAGVLSTLQRHYGDTKIGPNEQKTALCAMSSMFQLLDENKGSCKREISVTELFLLSSDNKLRKTSDLCYAEPHLMKQLLESTDKKFLVPLKQCGIDVVNESHYIELLPERIRPKNIGNGLTEKPLESCECHQGSDCAHLAHIKKMLKSEEMTQVLMRLLQHQLKTKRLSEKTKDCIQKLRSYDKVFCKMELEIGLFDTEDKLIGKRNSSTKAFINSNTSTMLLLHQDLSIQASNVTFKQIAKCCNDFLGGLLNATNVGHLQTALASGSPNKMNDMLGECDIPDYGIVTQEQEDGHSPGKIVPLDIRHLLDQDPYNLFKEEEIVGFERTITNPIDSESRLSSAGDSFTEIIFAVIIEQTDKSSGMNRHYRIGIGLDEPIVVSVLSLYKFMPPEKATDSTDRKLPDCPEQDNEQIKQEVKEAFTLAGEERQTAIRRLYRKWHPDKNRGQESRATEAFKSLKQQILNHDSTSHYSQNFSKWESEADRSYQDATSYQQCYGNRRRNRRSKSGLPFSFTRETPDPRSARVWFSQAEEHFKTAQETSRLHPVPRKQWIAFQLHQAAELALKGAQYSLTGRPDMDCHDLLSLARTVCHHREVHSTDLVDRVTELDHLGCQFSKPRYPEIWLTSGKVFEHFCTEKTFEVCEKLFVLVRDIIGIQRF